MISKARKDWFQWAKIEKSWQLDSWQLDKGFLPIANCPIVQL
jgi:hypothetical protein